MNSVEIGLRELVMGIYTHTQTFSKKHFLSTEYLPQNGYFNQNPNILHHFTILCEEEKLKGNYIKELNRTKCNPRLKKDVSLSELLHHHA